MKTIPEAALAQHVAVLGKTGSGKTSTEKLAVEQVVAQGFRVCVLDTIKSDWWGITSSADGRKPGLPFRILGGPRGHLPLHSSAGKAIGEIVGSGKLPLSIIDMADFEAGGIQRFFVDFAPALMRSAKGVIYLVIEEAHEVAPKERAGFGAENMSIHWAKKLATAGRSKGIRLIVATQRVQSLHNAVLGSCETVIAHRLTTPADQEPVVKWLKANADKETVAKVEASLSSLPAGSGWICSGEARIFEKASFRKFSTFDNTATPTGDGAEITVKTAPVDQEELRSIIGDAVKEAEANDPRLLKAELGRLRAALAKKPAAAVPKVETPSKADTGAIKRELATTRKALEQAMKFITRITAQDFIGDAGKIDQKRLHEAITAAIDHATKQLDVKLDGQRKSFEKWRADGERMLRDVEKLLKNGEVVVDVTVKKNEPFSVAPSRAPAAQRNTVFNGDLTAGHQKILDKLAWLESMGLYPAPKNTLAAVCGVSPTSGGYFNNLGTLRTAGLIDYPQPGTVCFTDAGRATANPVIDDGRSVYEHWLEVVDAPQRKILERLFALHPKQAHKDELAGDIGVSATSGGYFNNLGRLRTLGAVDYPQRGYVALTKYVMP